ncbi:hypothetical protein CBCST_21340 [Clostridium botulinum C str. Stockholm]|nr:hypothetical protein CBCST_21340 [Clostridium botulinum C str. Stockholm]
MLHLLPKATKTFSEIADTRKLRQKLKVKKGDKVIQGQQIGSIGKTSLRGMSQEIGNDFLHFEILKKSDGDPQFSSENPEKIYKVLAYH